MDISLKGKRVELVNMDDSFTKLVSGDRGTITFTDDIGSIHVNWDKGSNLALIPGVDSYKFIKDEE